MYSKKIIYSCDPKLIFFATVLYLVSHDPSEIRKYIQKYIQNFRKYADLAFLFLFFFPKNQTLLGPTFWTVLYIDKCQLFESLRLIFYFLSFTMFYGSGRYLDFLQRFSFPQ